MLSFFKISNIKKIAYILVILYFLIAIVDFFIFLFLTHISPTIQEESYTVAEKVFLSDILSDDTSKLQRAANMVLPKLEVESAIDIHDACLAEQLHRKAASLGSESSRNWLIRFYSEPNFPPSSGKEFDASWKAEQWRRWRSGSRVPSRPFSLTRYGYFWSNSCVASYANTSAAQRAAYAIINSDPRL